MKKKLVVVLVCVCTAVSVLYSATEFKKMSQARLQFAQTWQNLKAMFR